ARLRQRLSIVYAAATLAGSRVFHASSAIRAFRVALSAVKGGSGGRSILRLPFSLFVKEYLKAFYPQRPEYRGSFSFGLTEVARGIHPLKARFICSLALLWASISNFYGCGLPTAANVPGRTKASGQPSPPRRKLDRRRGLAGKTTASRLLRYCDLGQIVELEF